MPMLFGSKASSWWNYNVNDEKDDDSSYSVSKLRYLYATLLTAITPEDEESPEYSLSLIDNSLTSGDGESVKNFRRTDGLSRKVRSRSMDEEDEVTFELFAAASSTNSSASIWRKLAASIDSSGETFGKVAQSSLVDNDISVAELIHARKLEARVVELIRSIGEIVVYGEKRTNVNSTKGGNKGSNGTISNEAVFEYFCDKNMMSLLADIAKSKPSPGIQSEEKAQYSGIIWTALVKAQVLQTISILITNVSDPRSLYYLLSNNYINEVVASMVPLQQWTTKALDEILPVYVSFLKTLALRLAKSPELFQFFCDNNGASSTLPCFPLFYAAVEVVSSPSNVAQSDTFVRTTAQNVILNICQLKVAEIRTTIKDSYTEQQMLFSYLCDEIVGRYEAIANFMVQECTNGDQTGAFAEDAAALVDNLQFINDLLWCSHKEMNFRLCENIMHYVIYHIMEDILEAEPKETPNNSAEEAKYEAAMFVLLQIFKSMDYDPLLKMMTVSLLHPFAPIEKQVNEMSKKGVEFIVTPILNAIVQNEYVVVKDGEDENNDNFLEDESTTTHLMTSPSDSDEESDMSVAAISNKFRSAMLQVLSGKSGRRSFILTNLLFECILKSKIIDFSMMKIFELIPSYSDSNELQIIAVDSPIERALCSFLNLMTQLSSFNKTKSSIDCAISLILSYMPYLLQSITNGGSEFGSIEERINKSELFSCVKRTKHLLASECKRMKATDGTSELISEIMIMEITKIYSIMGFMCDLTAASNELKSDINNTVVATMMTSCPRGTEDVHFTIRAYLLFEALDGIFTELRKRFTSIPGPSADDCSPRWVNTLFTLRTTCKASDGIISIGSLEKQSIVGSDFDAKDKKHFKCYPALAITDGRPSDISHPFVTSGGLPETDKEQRRLLADKILINSSSKTVLNLVVDLTELLILKPKSKDDPEKGTLLCCTLLNNIIAIVADDEWLHIAMRDVEDVGVLIKKGNMALRFENSDICLKAKQYIDDNRKIANDSVSLMIDDLLDDDK